MVDDSDELIRLTKELDVAMIEGMTKYNLSPLSISAVILARLTFLNTVTRGAEGLGDYYDLLERHSEHVYKQWELQIDLDIGELEKDFTNDNKKSADIIQFPVKEK